MIKKGKKKTITKKRRKKRLPSSISFDNKNGVVGRGLWQIFRTKKAGELVIILEVRDIEET